MGTTNSVEHLDTIIEDIKNLIEHKFDFQAFIVITLGIEYLGNFSDEKDFKSFSNSEIRFKNGLDHFKNIWYQNNKDLLFKELRGSLIHQYRPGTKLLLTSVCKNSAPLADHLKKIEGGENIILVLEKLFEDFQEATKRFKNKLAKANSFNKEKLSQTYFSVAPIISPTNDAINYLSSGFTETVSMTETTADSEQLIKTKKPRKDKK